MKTREIAKALKLTAQLMELHNENPFKAKSIANAAFKLDKTGIELGGLSVEDLENIEGIGKSIAGKIYELQTAGALKELTQLLEITPVGVIEMLAVKGIGPKKVGQLWKELQVESVGELLYACHENRLVDLKGFGSKTQDQVKKFIEFSLANSGKFLYATVEETAFRLVDFIRNTLHYQLVSLTGRIRRKCEVVEKIEILVAGTVKPVLDTFENSMKIPIEIIICKEETFYPQLFETTGSKQHLELLLHKNTSEAISEEEIYHSLGLQFIEPELREGLGEVEMAKQHKIPQLLQMIDLRGILHNHTTYSDGVHSLREMAVYCKQLGYEYLGICDHSQSAFYANGLKIDRILEQQQEIDRLNEELAPFKIFKGIESDILNDGSLDYKEHELKLFDFVVASIHSNLKMDKEKATSRLLKAIENPYTTILGHMTGRLLLSREGYPVDYKKIIEACAKNNVIIELNAHPYRLDIDWRWIPYCIENGVKISINPDAHEKEGYHDMHYGVCAARKGMLAKEMCFNAFSREEMETYFLNKRLKH